MGASIQLDNGASGSVSKMLPRTGKELANTQRSSKGILPVTSSLDERVARVEGRMDTGERMNAELQAVLREIRQELKVISEHSVRISHIELRDRETRQLLKEEADTRHTEINGVGSRISDMIPDASLNTHSRTMFEKYFVPVLASAVTGVLAWAAAAGTYTGGS